MRRAGFVNGFVAKTAIKGYIPLMKQALKDFQHAARETGISPLELFQAAIRDLDFGGGLSLSGQLSNIENPFDDQAGDATQLFAAMGAEMVQPVAPRPIPRTLGQNGLEIDPRTSHAHASKQSVHLG